MKEKGITVLSLFDDISCGTMDSSCYRSYI